jgi:hypothetical protein
MSGGVGGDIVGGMLCVFSLDTLCFTKSISINMIYRLATRTWTTRGVSVNDVYVPLPRI